MPRSSRVPTSSKPPGASCSLCLTSGKPTPSTSPTIPPAPGAPKSSFDLVEREGRKWFTVVNRDTLQKVPLFSEADPILLSSLTMALRPVVFRPGDIVIQKGQIGRELYVISRGEVEVLADDGKVVATLSDGAYFGEIALLTSSPRTATVRARTDCDCFLLDKADFARVLRDRPQFMKAVMDLAGKRYDVAVQEEAILTEQAGA